MRERGERERERGERERERENERREEREREFYRFLVFFLDFLLVFSCYCGCLLSADFFPFGHLFSISDCVAIQGSMMWGFLHQLVRYKTVLG